MQIKAAIGDQQYNMMNSKCWVNSAAMWLRFHEKQSFNPGQLRLGEMLQHYIFLFNEGKQRDKNSFVNYRPGDSMDKGMCDVTFITDCSLWIILDGGGEGWVVELAS